MANGERTRSWMFLTNHGHVFLTIAKDPEVRVRDIADIVGITERSAHSIIQDLADEGYVSVVKEGRRNVYEIHPELPFRHPQLRDHDVGEIVKLLAKDKAKR